MMMIGGGGQDKGLQWLSKDLILLTTVPW